MADALPSRLRCSTESWRLQNASRSGGQSISGTQQFVASPSSQWRAKISLHLLDDADYLEARGWLASLDGQAGTFLVGPTDWRGVPWILDPYTSAPITPRVQKANAAVDTAYTSNPDTAGSLQFALTSSAPMNATVIRVTRVSGGLLKRGQYLGIGGRMHTIVVPPIDTGKAGDIDLAIRPWLRADYPAGTAIQFAAPQTLMRLADADQGDITMTTSPLADLSLDLIEAF